MVTLKVALIVVLAHVVTWIALRPIDARPGNTGLRRTVYAEVMLGLVLTAVGGLVIWKVIPD